MAQARGQAVHGGPLHDLADKRSLAIHLGGVWHTGSDGRLHRINFPSIAVLSRWKRSDLEEEHRLMHE